MPQLSTAEEEQARAHSSRELSYYGKPKFGLNLSQLPESTMSEARIKQRAIELTDQALREEVWAPMEARQQRELKIQIEEAGGKAVVVKGIIVGAEIGEMSYGVEQLRKGVSIPSGVEPSGFDFEKAPSSVVSVAPSFVESYKEYISGKPKVTSTLSFLGEKASGLFAESKFSPVRRTGYAKPVGELAKGYAETGVYFTPIIGAPLIFGASAEMLLTPTGWKEISKSGEFAKEKYGVPKVVTISAQVGLYTAGAYFGGRGTISQTEKMLGLPKTETKLLGVQQRVAVIEGKEKVITEAVFESRIKRLFGTTTEIGRTKAVTYFKPFEKVQVGETTIFGVAGRKAVSLPSAEIKVINLKQFQAFQKTISKPSIIKIEKQIDYLKVSKEFEGFEQISWGKVAVAKKLYGKPSKIRKEYFAGFGKGFKADKQTYVFGESAIVKEGELLKVGKGKYEGLIFEKEALPKVYDVIGGKGLELKMPQISYPQEVLKSAEAFGVAVAPKIKPSVVKLTPIKTEAIIQPSKMQVQELKTTFKPTIQMPSEVQVTKIKIKQVSILKSELKLMEVLKIKQVPMLKSKLKPMEVLKIKQVPMLKTKVLVKQKAKTRYVQSRYGIPATTIPRLKEGWFPFFALPKFKYVKRRPARKPIRVLKRQPTEYKPTYTARALGIKAFKIPKGYKLGAGGIIGRPIIKVRTK